MLRRPREAPAGGEGLATAGSGNARSRNPRAYERMAHPQQRKGNTTISDEQKSVERARRGDPPAGSAPTRVQVPTPCPTSGPGPSAKEEERTCSWWRSNDKGEAHSPAPRNGRPRAYSQAPHTS